MVEAVGVAAGVAAAVGVVGCVTWVGRRWGCAGLLTATGGSALGVVRADVSAEGVLSTGVSEGGGEAGSVPALDSAGAATSAWMGAVGGVETTAEGAAAEGAALADVFVSQGRVIPTVTPTATTITRPMIMGTREDRGEGLAPPLVAPHEGFVVEAATADDPWEPVVAPAPGSIIGGDMAGEEFESKAGCAPWTCAACCGGAPCGVACGGGP